MITPNPPIAAMTATPWYQSGDWPLVGAILTLAFAAGIGLWRIYVQGRVQLNNQLAVKRLDYLSQQLAEFYDPLFALLLTNSKAFNEAGPPSFPKDPLRRDTAGEVWKQIKEKVLAPNNAQIASIIRAKSHLIDESDSIAGYIALFQHIAMYEIFQKNPTELYEKFQFPAGITRHIETVRDGLITKTKEARQPNEFK